MECCFEEDHQSSMDCALVFFIVAMFEKRRMKLRKRIVWEESLKCSEIESMEGCCALRNRRGYYEKRGIRWMLCYIGGWGRAVGCMIGRPGDLVTSTLKKKVTKLTRNA